MLLVKRRIKKKQPEALWFSSHGGGKNRIKAKHLNSDWHVWIFSVLVFCLQPWTPPRTRARMWNAAAIRCASLRVTRGPCVSIARNWSTGGQSFSLEIRGWLVCKACYPCLEDLYMDTTDISVTLVSTAVGCVPVKSLSVSGWRAID